MLDFTFSNQLKDKTVGVGFFYNLFKKAIAKIGLSHRRIGISLNLIGKDKIKSLNKDYGGKDKVTDVLSFPLHNNFVRDVIADAKIKKNDILELGDIFICLPVAEEDAQKEKVDIKAKLGFLAIHGFLHLIGYDHKASGDEVKMSALQEKILKS